MKAGDSIIVLERRDGAVVESLGSVVQDWSHDVAARVSYVDAEVPVEGGDENRLLRSVPVYLDRALAEAALQKGTVRLAAFPDPGPDWEL